MFRPYRDVRFSNDKTPYKTHQGAVVHPEGRARGAWYVQISADGLRVAGGCWRLESDQVARYRRAVADDVQGPRLQAEVDRLAAAGWSIDGERLIARAGRPRRGRARLDLLSTSRCTPAAAGSRPSGCTPARALDEVRTAWRDLTALNTWLADNVGATAKEAAAADRCSFRTESRVAGRLSVPKAVATGFSRERRKGPSTDAGALSGMVVRRRPTLPPRLQGSTIGAERLSFRVRNVTGRFPLAMAAVTL